MATFLMVYGISLAIALPLGLWMVREEFQEGRTVIYDDLVTIIAVTLIPGINSLFAAGGVMMLICAFYERFGGSCDYSQKPKE